MTSPVLNDKESKLLVNILDGGVNRIRFRLRDLAVILAVATGLGVSLYFGLPQSVVGLFGTDWFEGFLVILVGAQIFTRIIEITRYERLVLKLYAEIGAPERLLAAEQIDRFSGLEKRETWECPECSHANPPSTFKCLECQYLLK